MCECQWEVQLFAVSSSIKMRLSAVNDSTRVEFLNSLATVDNDYNMITYSGKEDGSKISRGRLLASLIWFMFFCALSKKNLCLFLKLPVWCFLNIYYKFHFFIYSKKVAPLCNVCLYRFSDFFCQLLQRIMNALWQMIREYWQSSNKLWSQCLWEIC